jgi:ABC-type multidrug transport system permease subunit
MRATFEIARNDLRLFLRERTSWIWLIAVPLAFVYFMGFAVRGPGGPVTPMVDVRIENFDEGFLGRLFLEALGGQGLRVVGPGESDRAKRGITIPAGFTERVMAKQRVDVEFFKLGDADDAAAAMVELRLVRTLIVMNSLLVEYAIATDGAMPTEEGLRNRLQRDNPVTLRSAFAGRKPMPVGFNLSLPGNLVMYLLLNLMVFGGVAVAAERRNGVMRRLMTQALGKADLVTGKVCGLILLGLVQVGIFLLIGQFLLGVNIRDHWFAILVTLLVYVWVAASLGVLVGSLIKAEEKVIGVCLLTSLPMAALGGCWWPMEIVSPTLQWVALVVPTGWAMAALHQLITFGSGFAGAKEEIAVLALYGLAANLAAAKWFRG